MADFEFFKKEFEFKGKHAKMAQELWVRDDTERTYFKRLIDLYVAAAVVGFRVDRKADPDDKFRDNRTANLMALMERYGAGKMNVIPENEDETVRIQI